MLDTLVSVPNAVIIDYLKMFLEIFILTVVIYKTLHYLRGARGASVLAGITILLLVLTLLSKKLNLDVLNWLLTGIWGRSARRSSSSSSPSCAGRSRSSAVSASFRASGGVRSSPKS